MEESAINPLGDLIQPGTLWEKTQQRSIEARKSGALHSIETEYYLIQQQEIAFVVRTLANVARKEQARQQQTKQEKQTGKQVDPFLPYEADLFVGDITPTHICLLNKFNVVDHHLLIVTRAFEEQTDLLNLEDFVALWSCMREIDGLAFYNGGKLAGASQRHKHLQLVPLPFLPDVIHLPIELALANTTVVNQQITISNFPFQHALAFLDLDPNTSPTTAGEVMLNNYRKLLNQVGLNVDANTQQQPGAYNFLATKNWMLIVPRSLESFQNISINSLGFAGSLFVRDRPSLELLKELTPLKLLSNVGFGLNS
ncbi:Ap4A phosphorylase II [Chondrocystis sp. NIES-4102]|nr:Ap4A phosphorylase II [Chondrocystis sp. NIES-4102]